MLKSDPCAGGRVEAVVDDVQGRDLPQTVPRLHRPPRIPSLPYKPHGTGAWAILRIISRIRVNQVLKQHIIIIMLQADSQADYTLVSQILTAKLKRHPK